MPTKPQFVLVTAALLAAWGSEGSDQAVSGHASAGARTWELVAGSVVRGAGEGAVRVSPQRSNTRSRRRPKAVIRGATQVCERRGAGEIECRDIDDSDGVN